VRHQHAWWIILKSLCGSIPISDVDVMRACRCAVISRTPKEIEGMRVVCRMGREILDAAHAAIRPGVTTDDIDRVVRWQAMSCAFIWTTLPQHDDTS